MRRLSRILSVLVLGLALFQAVGSRLPGLTIACVETCPDDDAHGTCPIVCDCACRTPHRVPLTPEVAFPAPVLERAAFVVTPVSVPPSPDPRALLKVPRALLG